MWDSNTHWHCANGCLKFIASTLLRAISSTFRQIASSFSTSVLRPIALLKGQSPPLRRQALLSKCDKSFQTAANSAGFFHRFAVGADF